MLDVTAFQASGSSPLRVASRQCAFRAFKSNESALTRCNRTREIGDQLSFDWCSSRTRALATIYFAVGDFFAANTPSSRIDRKIHLK